MPVLALPSSPAALAKARWEDSSPTSTISPSGHSTRARSKAGCRPWSRLEELVTEAAALAMIAYTIDTSDPEKEATTCGSPPRCFPRWRSGAWSWPGGWWSRAIAPGAETTLARFRTSIEIFREANVPLFSELEELSARYQRITGSMTVEWEGQERPLPQLQPYLKSPDRAVRERAFRAVARSPTSSSAASLAGAVRPDVRAAPAGGAERRLRQLPRLHLPRQVPLRLHPGGLRAVPRGGRADGRRRRSSGCSRHGGGGSALDLLRPWDIAVDPVPRRAAPAVRDGRADSSAGRGGLRAGRSRARRRVPDHDRRAPARSRQPQGQGAGRLLRDAATTGVGPSSS